VGPRAGLDAVVKRKIPRPGRESNPRTLIVQSVVIEIKIIKPDYQIRITVCIIIIMLNILCLGNYGYYIKCP
jgi:hypothetical protein